MAHSVTTLRNITAVLILSCAVIGYAFAEGAAAVSGIIIKVDSDGLKAEIIATGKGDISDKVDIRNPQARLLAKRQAMAGAYQNLINAVNAISPDYFPKERYVVSDKFLKGATLTEARYYGDGSAEADIELDIALNGPIADKFEKDMRLLGYRVIEYDRPNTEIMEGEIK
ncbi:MAG: hypothetical protein PHI59_01970 [Candidatus Omnitrophica bacterium]|nr:hypothetical protein [Candidatus Omnitrophota bacterium]